MHQLICLAVLIVATLLFGAVPASRMASDGNWGGALGALVVPFVFFYGINAVAYYAVRLLRGAAKVASFANTKLNYIGLVFMIMSFLGQAAQRGA